MTPVTSPGASPAKVTFADTPLIVAETFGIEYKVAPPGVTVPSLLSGLDCPPPVIYTEIKEPSAAGVVATFVPPRTSPDVGPFKVPF
jgi:hypothetical protein